MWKVPGFCLVVMSFLAPSPVLAQGADPGHDLVRELRVIGERAGQAVSLLERILDQRTTENELRRLQVAVLALQLRSSAIGEIEARIQTLQDRASEARDYTTQLESELQRIDDVMSAETTPDAEKATHESNRQMVVRQIDLAQQRTWSFERLVLDLQNELVAKQREVEALEEIVMEGLSDF